MRNKHSLNLKPEFPNSADPGLDTGRLQLEEVPWPLPSHYLQTAIILFIHRSQSLSLPLSLQNACGNSITVIIRSTDKLELTYIFLPDRQSPGTADGEAGRRVQAAGRAGEGRAPSRGSRGPAAAEGTGPDGSGCVRFRSLSKDPLVAHPHRTAPPPPERKPPPAPPAGQLGPAPPPSTAPSGLHFPSSFRCSNGRPPRRPRGAAAHSHWSDLKRSRGRAGCAVPVSGGGSLAGERGGEPSRGERGCLHPAGVGGWARPAPSGVA